MHAPQKISRVIRSSSRFLRGQLLFRFSIPRNGVYQNGGVWGQAMVRSKRRFHILGRLVTVCWLHGTLRFPIDHPITAVTEGSIKGAIYHSQQHIYFRACRSNLACCFLALISGDLPSPRTAVHPTHFRCYPVFAFRFVTSFLFCRTVSGHLMPVALRNKPGGFLSSRALSARSRAMMRTPESKKW